MMNEQNASQPTLAPKVDKIEKILSRSTVPGEEKEELSMLLEKLRTMESEYSLFLPEIEKEKFKKQLIEKIENDSFWQESEQIVNAIKFSAGYIAEITLNNKSGTLESASFEIRHTGKQDRHITPVAIIEKIILNSLQKDANVEQILISLQGKIEVFKCNYTEKDNDYIQKIFVYFRHPDYKDANGIAMLIKIIGYLYNENILLSMNDNFIGIPDNLNDRYLIPMPKLIGLSKKHVHAKEGSFIRGLCKVLDNFEEEINANKQPTEIQIKQTIYSIFAMFDYLPLPENAKNPQKRRADSEKHRYKGESMERLCKVAASHLHFIFQAYPNIEQYRKSIFEGFLYYISDGVNLNDLLKIFACDTIEDLVDLLKIEKNIIDGHFLNDGFSLQYEQEAGDLYVLLKENVENILVTYNPDYLFDIHPEYNETATPMSTLNDNKINILFEQYCSEFLSHFLFQNKNFNTLDSESELLKIKVENFEKIFKENIIFYLKKDIEYYSQNSKSNKELIEQLISPKNNFYETLFSYIEKSNTTNLHKIIELSIRNAYLSQEKTEKISQENFRTIKIKVFTQRPKWSDVMKKLTYSVSTSSGDNYSPSYSDDSDSGAHSSEEEKNKNLVPTNIAFNVAFFQKETISSKVTKKQKGSSEYSSTSNLSNKEFSQNTLATQKSSSSSSNSSS